MDEIDGSSHVGNTEVLRDNFNSIFFFQRGYVKRVMMVEVTWMLITSVYSLAFDGRT